MKCFELSTLWRLAFGILATYSRRSSSSACHARMASRGKVYQPQSPNLLVVEAINHKIFSFSWAQSKRHGFDFPSLWAPPSCHGLTAPVSEASRMRRANFFEDRGMALDGDHSNTPTWLLGDEGELIMRGSCKYKCPTEHATDWGMQHTLIFTSSPKHDRTKSLWWQSQGSTWFNSKTQRFKFHWYLEYPVRQVKGSTTWQQC